MNVIFQHRDISWTQLLYLLAEGGTPRDVLATFGIDYADLTASFEK